MSKPKVGISACLLGHKVRYDGNDKYDWWINEHLTQYLEFIKVCPELEMGMGVPREPIQIERYKDNNIKKLRLVGTESQEDYTEHAEQINKIIIEALPELDGFILKNRSPSCGLERVREWDQNGVPQNVGRGFFAKGLLNKYPYLPVIEEGMLKDQHLRERFLIQVYAHEQFRQLDRTTSALQQFHQAYKFILLAFCEKSLRELGRIAASGKKNQFMFKEYYQVFFEALRASPTVRKQVNALQHIYGFIKNDTNEKEKKDFLSMLEKYQKGKIPYIAVYIFLKHLIEKYNNVYLMGQKYFTPYPEDAVLKLKVRTK